MGQEPDFTKTWWCKLQFDDPTQVHFDCDCKNCPDFEPIEVTCTCATSEDLRKDGGLILPKKKTKNVSGEELIGEIKWVRETVGDDGVPKSLYIYKTEEDKYVVYVIRAENESDAIRKVYTGDTMVDAMIYVTTHYQVEEEDK